MEKTSVTIQLEGGSSYQLYSQSCDVSRAVYQLACDGHSSNVCAQLEFSIPAFGSTHMLVESTTGCGTVVVYGVRCPAEGRMAAAQVAQRVMSVFGVDVSENMTVWNYPGSCADNVYPCGTLFTCGTPRSTSSSPPTSPLFRPEHLPITSPPSQFSVPRPVAISSHTDSTQALIAGTSNLRIPSDDSEDELADEDSAPATQFREGPVRVQTLIHETLVPVQKPQGGDAGGTVQLGTINLETPSRDQATPYPEFVPPKFLLTTQEEVKATVPLPVEAESLESEIKLPSQCDLTSSLVASTAESKKSGSNQLVVGIGQQRRISVGSLDDGRPTFGRHLSLPGGKVEKTMDPPVRNSSDTCLESLAHRPVDASTQHNRSVSDLGALPCKPSELPLQNHLASPSEGFPLPAGHSPSSPTKPLAIQRQDSVVVEKIELVLPKVTTTIHEQPENGGDCPLPNLNSDACETGEVVMAEADEGVICEAGESVTSEAGDSGASDIGMENEANDPIPMTAMMQQVHLLEHAMNGHCYLNDTCTYGNVEFTQAVEQMKAIVLEAMNGPISEDLKEYIRVHYDRCEDKNCKVPHMLGGCPPPGVNYSSDESDPTNSGVPVSSSSDSCRDVGAVSCDPVAAFVSTDSDVRRHQDQQAPPAALQLALPTHVDYPDVGLRYPLQPSQDQTAPFSPLLKRTPPLSPIQRPYTPSPDLFPSDQLRQTLPFSPMGSGGFLLPGHVNSLVKGHQVQESQLGAEAYGRNMLQVSDKGRSELRPRERRQYSYLEPSGGSGIRKMYGGGDDRLRGAKAGEFPNYNTLSKKPGTIIYSTEVSELVPGEAYPCPHNVPERDKLGKGGNGMVLKFPLGGKEYALKQTQYRESELNVWSILSHPNILPLLGVMLGEEHYQCYQFMPRMTGDLRSMTVDLGDLHSLLLKQPEQWKLVMSNAGFILEETLKGLSYLHSKDIQHSDLKANNILVMKKCSCPDILHCQCPRESKYDIKLADFDSLKKTKFPRKVAQFGDVSREPKNDLQMNEVKGTPAYRAPEQFKLCHRRPEFKKILIDGKECYDMEGPWCDMWSLGVIVLQMTLGSHNKGDYISKANTLVHRQADKMKPCIEGPVATIRLNKLLGLSHKHPQLKPLALVAADCLEIEFRNRLTAQQVLTKLQDSVSKNKLC